MRRRRLRIPVSLLWIAAVAAAGIAVNLYLALRPETLEAHLRQELSKVLDAPFELSSFELSWERGAEVRNLRLFSRAVPPAGSEGAGAELFSAPSVRVRPSYLALLAGRFEIEQIVVDSPCLRVERGREGRWSLDGLLAARPEREVSGRGIDSGPFPRLPAILIEGGTLLYTDASTFREPVSERAEEIYASLTRERDGSLRFKAQLRVPFARKLEAKGSVEPPASAEKGPVIRFEVSASKVDLSVPRDAYLPKDVAEEVRRLKLKGFMDLAGSFKWDRGEGLVPISIAADILRAELAPPSCPFPVKGLKGKVLFSERRIETLGLEGLFGSGKVSIGSKVDFAGPWLSLLLGEGHSVAASWTLTCGIDSFLVDHRLRDSLPAEIREVLEEYRIEGNVGVDLRVVASRTFPPRPEEVSATIRFDGVEFTYRKFPYLLTGLRGEVLVSRGRVTFGSPIAGRTGPIDVTVSGGGAALSADGDIDVIINAKSVPIDETLRSALPAGVRGIWDDFQLLGSGDAVIAIAREASGSMPEGPSAAGPRRLVRPRVTVAAYPRDVRMSYRGFPYEIRGISGKVNLDTGSARLTFEDLKGRHADQEITGLGVVELGHPSRGAEASTQAEGGRTLYKIEIQSSELAVDQDLVAALSEEGRRLLEDFNFRGKVKVGVSIHSTDRSDSEVEADVSLSEGSVRHRLFPYPLSLVRGHLKIEGDRSFVFTDFATAEDSRPAVIFNGKLTTRARERVLGFAFDVKGLTFDEKLVEALPPSLATFVTNIKLGGTYRGLVEGAYTFDESRPDRFSIVYGAKSVSAEEASVDFGVSIHDMVAKGSFAGGMEPERPHHLAGEVFVDSGWFNRIHLTKGEIDFVLGQEHEAIRMARRGEKVPGRDYLPPPAMVERLAEGKVRDTFQMLVHSPDVYGGQVDGFLYVDTGALRDVGGDFVGKGFEMAKAAEDVFGVKGTGTAGAAGGVISFTGRNGDSLSIKGKGEGAIDKARLVELPLFLGILSLIFGEGSSRHFFNEVLLKFEIADGKFRAPAKDGIEIRSPGIKLLGGGTMDFAGNLDLMLEPRVLDFQIPIVEQIFSVIKKGLAQVRIAGDLAKPKVSFETAAGILRIGIESGREPGSSVPLPADLRKGGEPKDLPPGPK